MEPQQIVNCVLALSIDFKCSHGKQTMVYAYFQAIFVKLE
jgi:hypothetical protein